MEDLPLETWLQELQDRDLCLRVEDILTLEEGQSMKILLLWDRCLAIAHRQFGAWCPPLVPTMFFRSNSWLVFRKTKGISGHVRFAHDYHYMPFEFQIEKVDGTWGSAPIEKTELEMVKTCRLGFQGVCAKWESLHDMPRVCLVVDMV